MPIHDDFRLSVQGALLGAVVPAHRRISIEIDEENRRCKILFCFDREPTAGEREMASVVATEVFCDDTEWEVIEEIEIVAAPGKPTAVSDAPIGWWVYERYEGRPPFDW